MTEGLWLLAGLIVGGAVSWYAKDLRTHLRMLIHDTRAQQQAEAPKKDNSGVIVQSQVRQKGKVIDLPDARNAGPTGIVRPRSPKQVKEDGDKYIDQLIENHK